jgi:hypothetical protein
MGEILRLQRHLQIERFQWRVGKLAYTTISMVSQVKEFLLAFFLFIYSQYKYSLKTFYCTIFVYCTTVIEDRKQTNRDYFNPQLFSFSFY